MATVQTEAVINTNRDGRKEVLVTLSTIGLTSGVAEIAIGGLGEILDFIKDVQVSPLVSDYVFAFNVAKSTTNPKNGLTITVQKMQISATNTWGNAATADIATAVLAIRARGL